MKTIETTAAHLSLAVPLTLQVHAVVEWRPVVFLGSGHDAALRWGRHARVVRTHPRRRRRRRVPVRLAHLVARGQLAVRIGHVGKAGVVHGWKGAVGIESTLVQIGVVHCADFL